MEKSIPSKIITPRKKTPRSSILVYHVFVGKFKKRAFEKAKKSNSTEDWETFRSLHKELTRQSRRYYRKYVRDACSLSMKKLYSLIKSPKRTPLAFHLSEIMEN